MELGIYTFGELTADPATGQTISPAQRLRDLVEEMELADQVGLDVFGVGEHHRPDYIVSAPAVLLAAGAAARGLHGSNFVGSPPEIIEKILFQHEIFRHERFLIQFTVGTLPHDKVMRSIELFGTQVAPAVRDEVARRSSAAVAAPLEAASAAESTALA